MEVPGLVDLQVNGYKGVDFSGEELTEADFVRVSQQTLQAGTSAFLATMITSPVEIYQRNLRIMADVIEKGEFEGRLLPKMGRVGRIGPSGLDSRRCICWSR